MNAKLIEKKDAIDGDWSDKDDAESQYDDMLNECYPEVFNILPARILSECDPIAYRCGFADYCDSLNSDSPFWLCPICGEEHDDEDKAVECCQPDEWVCSECGEVYDDEDAADACCTPNDPDDDEETE